MRNEKSYREKKNKNKQKDTKSSKEERGKKPELKEIYTENDRDLTK